MKVDRFWLFSWSLVVTAVLSGAAAILICRQIIWEANPEKLKFIPFLCRVMGRCLGKKSPMVVTSLGTVEGMLMTSKEGKRIFSYRGIPYGRPPLGNLRFKRPEPANSWSGTLNCKREVKKCLQPHVLFPDKRYMDVGSEDCLYLSVFTKARPK